MIKAVFLLKLLLRYRVASATGYCHALPGTRKDSTTTTAAGCVVGVVRSDGAPIVQSLGIVSLEADQVRIVLGTLEVSSEEGVVDRCCTRLFIIP